MSIVFVTNDYVDLANKLSDLHNSDFKSLIVDMLYKYPKKLILVNEAITESMTSLLAHKQAKLDESSQALAFAVGASQTPALRARSLRAAINSGIIRGTITEGEWKAELAKLMENPTVVRYFEAIDETTWPIY